MYDKMIKIRDLVNQPRKRETLMHNGDLWPQLCSSMDVIEDCESAVSAFCAGDLSSDKGGQYLAAYGVLQALYLQQDAVFNLCESLGIQKTATDYPKLVEIRDIRNASVGHPTKRERPKPTSYHFISQATLSPRGFELWSWDKNGNRASRWVSLPDLAADQRMLIAEILTQVIADLEKEQATHKEKFRMEKLAALFPDTLSYHFEKIFEASRDPELAMLGKINLDMISKALGRLREALERRGIGLDTYDSIKYLYDEIGYPITKLEQLFGGVNDVGGETVKGKDAYIFAFFVDRKMNELKELVQEIDQDYSS